MLLSKIDEAKLFSLETHYYPARSKLIANFLLFFQRLLRFNRLKDSAQNSPQLQYSNNSAQSMKILIINNMPHKSGIGNYVNQLLRAMLKLCSPFEIKCHSWNAKSYDSMFFRAMEIGSKSLLYSQESIRTFSLARFILVTPSGYDLYHIANPTLAPLAYFRRPSVVTVHDLIPYVERRSIVDYLLRLTDMQVKYCDRIICVSDHTKKDLVHFLDINPKIVRVIYYGVNHELFKPKDLSEAKERLTFLQDKKIVLNVGSEEPRKNVSTLLKAFSKLLKDIPNAVLVRVGEKTAHVQGLINLLGLNDKVFYFKAKPDEVAYFYNAADLLCFPSYYEGFGLPPLEAMSSGCPVIAGNRTSIPEVLGDAGILLDPFDIDGFAYWMREVLMNEDLMAKLNRKGLERSMNFSWEKCAKETLEVYREVL